MYVVTYVQVHICVMCICSIIARINASAVTHSLLLDTSVWLAAGFNLPCLCHTHSSLSNHIYTVTMSLGTSQCVAKKNVMFKFNSRSGIYVLFWYFHNIHIN